MGIYYLSMKRGLKIGLFVGGGILIVGGVLVGILALAGVFSGDSDDSSSSSTTSTSTSSSSSSSSTSSTNMSACSSCNTPNCTGLTSTSGCLLPDVVITDGTGTTSGETRFTVVTNNVPCHAMDNSGSYYLSCPYAYDYTYTVKIPTYCSGTEYYDGSACGAFDPTTVQPQLQVVAIFGRPPTASTHWSTTNVPMEVVYYDPLPGFADVS